MISLNRIGNILVRSRGTFKVGINRFQNCKISYGIRNNSTLVESLKNRGLIEQISHPEILLKKDNNKISDSSKHKLYLGIDPTAKSLHLGNVLPLMLLLQFYIHGHDIFTIIGGATSKIGDPSGKKTTRKLITNDERIHNMKSIEFQIKRFFDNAVNYYDNMKDRYELNISNNDEGKKIGKLNILNNYNWWKNVNFLEFLSKFGPYIRIQSMLSRDSISNRLKAENGLNFNEFTYQILQAYDFYHLNKEHKVDIQIGGNDQWGNITAGIDLISKIPNKKSSKKIGFGLTVPLLTTSSGEKFGKSAGNAIFIDPDINSSYDIYQYFFNTTDSDLIKFFKFFTLLPNDIIKHIELKHFEFPEKRYGQRKLAWEITEMIYGEGSGNESELVSNILFDNIIKPEQINDDLIKILEMLKLIIHVNNKSINLISLISLLSNCSNNESRRKISQGMIYLGPNHDKITDINQDITPFIVNNLLFVRIGKQKKHIVKIMT